MESARSLPPKVSRAKVAYATLHTSVIAKKIPGASTRASGKITDFLGETAVPSLPLLHPSPTPYSLLLHVPGPKSAPEIERLRSPASRGSLSLSSLERSRVGVLLLLAGRPSLRYVLCTLAARGATLSGYTGAAPAFVRSKDSAVSSTGTFLLSPESRSIVAVAALAIKITSSENIIHSGRGSALPPPPPPLRSPSFRREFIKSKFKAPVVSRVRDAAMPQMPI